MPKKKSIKTQFKESDGKTAHFDTYSINTTDTVITMTVTPGDTGQASLTEAYLENQKIFSDQVGTITAFKVGTNKSLRGKFLEVYTVITDIPGPPDKTNFRFQLSGGTSPFEYFTEKSVTVQGASVVYKITIFFTIH